MYSRYVLRSFLNDALSAPVDFVLTARQWFRVESILNVCRTLLLFSLPYVLTRLVGIYVCAIQRIHTPDLQIGIHASNGPSNAVCVCACMYISTVYHSVCDRARKPDFEWSCPMTALFAVVTFLFFLSFPHLLCDYYIFDTFFLCLRIVLLHGH